MAPWGQQPPPPQNLPQPLADTGRSMDLRLERGGCKQGPAQRMDTIT